MHINLTTECVHLIECLSPLRCALEKTDMGRFWEVPVSDEYYRVLVKARHPTESWSDVIMRLIRERQHLEDLRQ